MLLIEPKKSFREDSFKMINRKSRTGAVEQHLAGCNLRCYKFHIDNRKSGHHKMMVATLIVQSANKNCTLPNYTCIHKSTLGPRYFFSNKKVVKPWNFNIVPGNRPSPKER